MVYPAPRYGYPRGMSSIEVVPHGGNRWGVKDHPDRPPVSEYPTREQAELAARDLARESGAEVIVRDEDPTGLAEVQDHEAEPAGAGPDAAPGNAQPSERVIRDVGSGF
jgi:hypothetical protein